MKWTELYASTLHVTCGLLVVGLILGGVDKARKGDSPDAVEDDSKLDTSNNDVFGRSGARD